MVSNIPVYVVAFNQATYVRDSVAQLRKYTQQITIVDNSSTYEPLLEYYASLADDPTVHIVRRNQNDGHNVVTKTMYEELPEVFAITDPDLQFPESMPLDALDQMHDVGVKYNAHKVGVALDISPSLQFCDATYANHTIRGWESRWWRRKIPHPTLSLYDADIDTTLAVYNKKI